MRENKKGRCPLKRFVIALVLLAAILGISGYSLMGVYRFREQATPLLTEMLEKAENGSIDDATALAFEFEQLWDTTQKSLIRFVRHEPLDRITCLAARLPYLGKYQDESQFSAQANELIASVENLWDDELPTLRNLF